MIKCRLTLNYWLVIWCGSRFGSHSYGRSRHGETDASRRHKKLQSVRATFEATGATVFRLVLTEVQPMTDFKVAITMLCANMSTYW